MTAPTSRRRRRSPLRTVLAVLALIPAIGVAALPWVDGLGWGLLAPLQALIQVLLLVMLVLVGLALLLRTWAAAGILVLGMIGAVLPVLTPSAQTRLGCADPVPFTVVAFNAEYGQADPRAFAEILLAAEPDAVMLVEADEELIRAVLADGRVRAALPHRTREVSPGGVAGSVILSAHPLGSPEELPGSTHDQPIANAEVPGIGPVTLAAVHTNQPIVTPERWHSGLAAIETWVDERPAGPLVMAGDFNASTGHPGYRALAAPLDSAASARSLPWPGPTWPVGKMVPAFTEIDHVLAAELAPHSYDRFEVSGSDHRGIIAELQGCPA